MSELLLSLMTVKTGGNWCCKMFDTMSYFSASIVYITGILYEDTFIVKPVRSRSVNSERYVVGLRRKPDTPFSIHVFGIINDLHINWDDNNIPDSLVPVEMMTKDSKFMKSFTSSVRDLADKQISALDRVMTEVEKRL